MRFLRFTASLPLVLLAASTLAGCKSGGQNDDPLMQLSAAESLTEGQRLMETEKYAQARKYLTHAFEVEPNSASGREALLLVADSLYKQGGTANLVQAGVHERVLTVAYEKQSESNAMWALSIRVPFQQGVVAGAGGYFAPLIRAYIRLRGRSGKHKILSRTFAYHGVGLATTSMTGLPSCYEPFDLPLPGFVHVPGPRDRAHHRARRPRQHHATSEARVRRTDDRQ